VRRALDPIDIHGCYFYNEDCITGAREHIPDDSIDLIITDPPYGINGGQLHLHYNRNEKHVLDGYIEVPSSEYPTFSINWIKEAERILKPGGSIYIISGYTNLFHILNALHQTELREINHIIWKYNFGVFTRKKYVSSHYHILYYEKPGESRTFNVESRYGLNEKNPNGGSSNYRDREDVWEIPREYKPRRLKNKNELPDDLLVKMMQYSSNEGDLVCDFFLGGFSTARVAIGLNRKLIGFELSSQIFWAKIDEMKSIIPGELFHDLRKPELFRRENQGKSWSSEDLILLAERFIQLTEEGTSKKDTIGILQHEFKRGYWSIERALKKNI